MHLTDLLNLKGLPRSGTPPSFPRRRGLPQKRAIRDVKKVVAVSSAKGGVGKSTVAGSCFPSCQCNLLDWLSWPFIVCAK
jgi:ATP-binding protein involved in chromosome partitioning